MDRRDSIKSFLIGSLAAPALLNGCAPEADTTNTDTGADNADNAASGNGHYGRTPEEKAYDEMLKSQTFFTDNEMTTIAILCDIILPASEEFGSATDAEVPAFIEFISKDITSHQLPLRGGISWLNHRSVKDFGVEFKDLSKEQQVTIIDEIAYPDPDADRQSAGVLFFDRMRNLTLTGYYTTEMGLQDLGYVGNRPNVWDGVPQNVLDKHGLAYEEEWLAKCVTPEQREAVAEWDEDGNLLN
ncbi:gluconate 2-dehydrogenase subunit 3 family protein [Flavilitoribacter nigricans]|uniref:Tat pathway signal protein n=1 Tax=Flavilitoribacter nigricans (strain ATCC 23147 / DSM 23189 / NBRC 102662 / NCIMB 1420 / SS-2) TaxID=1122177 RepID=A0A2D0NA95_FLAN2|nr:gluconate 2-dehydrogenase subunit 3 family protein [Flavilitoribacter nigricans]PHN05308.1 Tat pathway signal protein [Flavilitoribacter nigricans DSM 23189 = NBRC 102662]